MITYVEIDGFKTFHNFKMEFAPLTVIAGVNASGKSNLFDALSLLSKLAETDLRTAYSEQRGDASELFTNYGIGVVDGSSFSAEEMHFVVEMLIDRTVRDNWGGEATLKYTRLRYELKIKRETNSRGIDELRVIFEKLTNLKHEGDRWLERAIDKKDIPKWRPSVKTGKRGIPYIDTIESNGTVTIRLPQDGRPGGKATPANAVSQTVLSGVNSVDFPHVFAAKEEMLSWTFLQLNPQALREPTRQDIGIRDSITQSGENLAATLFRLKADDPSLLKDISRTLNRLLPQIVNVDVRDDKANKQYVIEVTTDDDRTFSSRVLSEGTLRLLALCILQFDDRHRGLICFEEPENGIHPFRIKATVDLLKNLTSDFSSEDYPLRQVLVNTHSPVLVAEMFKQQDSHELEIFFSELVAEITELGGRRVKLYVTKTLPVITPQDSNGQGVLPIEPEGKISFHRLKTYLATIESEKILAG